MPMCLEERRYRARTNAVQRRIAEWPKESVRRAKSAKTAPPVVLTNRKPVDEGPPEDPLRRLAAFMKGRWEGTSESHSPDATWLPWGDTKLSFSPEGRSGVLNIRGEGVAERFGNGCRVRYEVFGNIDLESGTVRFCLHKAAEIITSLYP